MSSFSVSVIVRVRFQVMGLFQWVGWGWVGGELGVRTNEHTRSRPQGHNPLTLTLTPNLTLILSPNLSLTQTLLP